MNKMTSGEKTFQIFNYIFLTALGLCMIFPILQVLAMSFSDSVAINAGKVSIFPVNFTLDNYDVILNDKSVWRAFGVSVFITVFGTMLSLIGTSSLAYPLSRPEYVGRKYILMGILITMIFAAPLIPNYLLIKNLHMLNTLWALIIPGAISAYNLFVMRSFFMNLPNELIDSARIDGCGETRLMWSIVLPLSKPAMATMGLFYAVSHWNTYSSALYYITDRTLNPLQVRLREIVLTDFFGSADFDAVTVSPEGVKMAIIIVTIVPIIMVYPFLQKYFIKGMLIGSVKS